MKSTVTVAAAHRFAAFILSVVVFHSSIAFAQETQPTPSPSPTVSAADARYLEMKKALEREKELAEIEAAIAKSRKDVLDAAPKPKATPNTGDLTLSGEDIGYDIIVYRELGKTTTRIASSLQRTVPDSATIAIFDSSAFADWTFYRRSLPLFKIVIEDLTADYCLIANKEESDVKSLDLTSTGFATAIAGAGNIVGQFADLLSYFKTQTTMTGKTVTIPEEAVVASLFSNLSRDNGLTLLYPKTFGLDAPVFCGQTTTARSCCAKGAGDCTETRPVYCSEVANSLDALYRARRAAFAAKGQSPELRKLENYFAEFLKLVSDATPTTTETVLKKFVNAEQFAQLQKRPNLYYLEIKSLRAVGTQRVRKNLFFLTDKLDYSGGLVVQWTLFDKDGQVKNSGIETSFDGFIPPKELQKPPVNP